MPSSRWSLRLSSPKRSRILLPYSSCPSTSPYLGRVPTLAYSTAGLHGAYVIGVISLAFAGKVIGGTIAARLCKLGWRESLTVGVLMSCKDLVEVIVLNIGLQAKILNQRTLTIFIVMALVTTSATTPLTSALYPPWYQKKRASWKRSEIDRDGNRLAPEDVQEDDSEVKRELAEVQRLLVHLQIMV